MAHGSGWTDSLTVDAHTGRSIGLGELVEVDALSDFCWQQISELTGPIEDEGKRFAREYPREAFRRLGSSWNVAGDGLRWGFGYLLGYAGAELGCFVKNEDLRRFAKAGVSVPF